MAAKPYKPPPPETFKGKAFRPYVIAIGQLALAWNELQEHLGYLFTSIMPEDKYDRAMHVWYSSSQDRAQREMLKASLISRPEEFDEDYPLAASDITWLLGQIHALEEARNNAIHSPLFRFHTTPKNEIEPFWLFGHPRALKLAKRPAVLAEFRWCRDTALILRDFAAQLDDALTSQGKKPGLLPPWPKRPSLPNRGQKKDRPNQRRQSLPK